MAEGYRFRVDSPAVRPSVRLSQTCWCYISKTITDLNCTMFKMLIVTKSQKIPIYMAT